MTKRRKTSNSLSQETVGSHLIRWMFTSSVRCNLFLTSRRFCERCSNDLSSTESVATSSPSNLFLLLPILGMIFDLVYPPYGLRSSTLLLSSISQQRWRPFARHPFRRRTRHRSSEPDHNSKSRPKQRTHPTSTPSGRPDRTRPPSQPDRTRRLIRTLRPEPDQTR